MNYNKDLSIVISLFNEEESLPELISWIEQVMTKEGYSYEVIMVDDGSTDRSWSIVNELAQKNPAIRGISFRRNYGKSAALYHGFAAAEGRVVPVVGRVTVVDGCVAVPGLLSEDWPEAGRVTVPEAGLVV